MPEKSTPQPARKLLHSRLSFMMFLHFFSLGAITPVFSLYLLRVLGFQGTEVGTILAVGSLATVVTPLATAWVADRFISGRHLLAVLNFISAVFFYLLITSRDFTSVFWFYTLAMAAKGPTFALSNSITFQHVSDGKRHFPRIRLWGTIGWIAAGWFFSALWFQEGGGTGSLSLVITLASLASALLGFYSLTLPEAPLPSPEPPAAAKKRFGRLSPDLLAFLVVTVLVSAADKFYFFGTSIHLSQAGWEDKWILPVMSLGQVTEVVALFFLSRILPKMGFRRVFLLGVGLQIFRFALLALLKAPWELALTISIHGLCFSFFFANAFVYIDSRTTGATRARAHQLYIFLLEGVGVTLGNVGAGLAAQQFTAAPGGAIDFSLFWLVPGALTAVSFLILALIFKPSLDGTRGTA